MQNKKENLLYGITAIIIGALTLILGIFLFSVDITQETGYMGLNWLQHLDTLFETWGAGSLLYIFPMLMFFISIVLIILGTLKVFNILKNPLVIKILTIIIAVFTVLDMIIGIIVCSKFGSELTELFDFGLCVLLPITILASIWTLICHKIIK